MEEDIQKYSPSVMFRGTPCSFGLLPQGYCEGKNPLNLKKTTSSVLSVIVNYKVYLNRIQIHRQKKHERAKDGIYVYQVKL